jgi:AraC-like DNA-binding protein
MPLIEHVQHDSPLGRWELARWRPAEPLKGYIEELWHMRSSGSYTRERLLPRPHMDVLINLGDPHRLIPTDGTGSCRLYERSWIAGLQDRYLDVESPSKPWLMGIRFRPSGPLALVRVPLAELTNVVIDLDLVVGPSIERLRQRLVETPRLERRFQLLERYLMERLAPARAPRADVGHAVGRLIRTGGLVRIRALSAEIGVSQKHLIHLFREQVGLSPKRFARIVRLNSVLKEMSAASASALRRPDWADLAVRFGYYDQPHFVREFREFTGTTPAGFLLARGPDGDSVVLES